MTLDLQPARDALARFRGAPSATDDERSRWGRDDFLAHGQDRRDHYLRHAPGVAAELEHLLSALSSPPADDVREALEAIWDDGNATGLDGWVGPGRGTLPIDPEAVEARDRSIERNAAAFEVRLRGTVTEPCEWCPEHHTGFAEWQGDGLAHPSCGREGHGTNFEPARGTVTDADDAETKAQIIADLAESYAYVHAVSRTSSQVYKWLMSRSAAAREARS